MLKIKTRSKYIRFLSHTVLIASMTGMFFLPSHAQPTMGKKVLLEKNVELPDKNIKARMIRVTFPPGFKTPWHTHRGPGPRYVIKGKLKIIEDGKEKTYSAGDVFWESGLRMSAENLTEEEAEVVIFELGPY